MGLNSVIYSCLAILFWLILKLDWISILNKLLLQKEYVELEHTVGPLPVGENVGKEVVTRFRTNISNEGIFYTDANGREMKKRRRNYRETYTYDSTLEPVASNYYPINSRILVNDSSRALVVLTDRSQGGGSIAGV